MNRIAFAIPSLLICALFAFAQPDKAKPLAETFAELLPGLEKADRGAQQKWQDICNAAAAPGGEKLRAEACTLMVAKLDAKTPAATRMWLLTQLQRIGREESVAPLTQLIDEKDDTVRESAVRALANNPSPKATVALAAGLNRTSGSAKVGLLNALGHRADAAAAGDVGILLEGGGDIAVAAARALGRIPGPESLKVLKAARTEAKGAVRAAIGNALLVHADRMMVKDTDGAAAIYKLLDAEGEARAIRLAATRGTIQTAGDKAGKLILTILAGDDAGARAVAVGQIESLTAGALKTLAASLEKLPAPSRVSVLTAIAARGDKSQLPVALAAAKSADADVKRAGILALGRLGDASAVEFLLDAMSGKDATAGLAAESLAALPAEGVNEKLIAVLNTEKTAARSVALIGILERRKASEAVPALLKAANGTDAVVRNAAFAGLKTLATPVAVPEMVAALVKLPKGIERNQAEFAIVAVSTQSTPGKRADPVLAAMKKEPERTADLLPLLGRLGGTSALKVVREGVAGKDASLREAGVVGLCNWPDASGNDDLLALATGSVVDTDKQRAIQALIRINAVLIDRTPEERLVALETLKKTMTLATRDDERRALLDGIGFVRHIETLHFVLLYLDQPALAQSACRAVVELAHSKMLREPNKAEFAKVLDRVIVLCKDKGLVDRAKSYKEGR